MPFREALGKTTFYKDWKAKYGDEAWGYLEKFSGKLVSLDGRSTADSRAEPDKPFWNWHERTSTGHGPWTRPCTSKAWADRPRWLAGLDTLLGFLVEIPAAILVLTEIVVLLAGVISRYVFHSPIIWSDELASILFLWLAMLGAVVAFRRAEHMRMTAVVGMLSPPMRAFLDVVAVAAALAFLFMTIDAGLSSSPRKRPSSPRRRSRFPIPGAPRPCRSASA